MSADEGALDNAPSNLQQQQRQMMQQQLAMQQAYFAQMQQQQQMLAQAMSLNQAYAFGNMMPSQYSMMAASANPMANMYTPATQSFDPSAMPFPQVNAHAMAANNPLASSQSPAYPLAFPHQLPSAALASTVAVATEGAPEQLHQKEVDRRKRERVKCRQRRVRKRQQWSDLLAGNQLLAASIAQHGRSRDALEDELTELRCAVLKRGKALQSLVAKRKRPSSHCPSPDDSLAAAPMSSPSLSSRGTADSGLATRLELVPPLAAS